jgi:hypothetical protein
MIRKIFGWILIILGLVPLYLLETGFLMLINGQSPVVYSMMLDVVWAVICFWGGIKLVRKKVKKTNR